MCTTRTYTIASRFCIQRKEKKRPGICKNNVVQTGASKDKKIY
jgi:hypothetical protein